MSNLKKPSSGFNLAGACRVLIIGHGRHGKDTVADLLRDQFGLRVVSSSAFACKKAVFPLLTDIYPDADACFRDRGNHRALWHHAIAAYNLRPGPMLAEQILIEHDAYIGMRKRDEFERARGLFDLVIWVDASDRLPPEPLASNELTASDADWVVDNNGDLDGLAREVVRLGWYIAGRLDLADAFARHG